MKNIIILLILTSHFCALGQGTSNGLSFDGINDYIRLNNYTLVKTNSAHTIEMWVKSAATETGAIYSEGFNVSNFRGQFRLLGNGSGKLSLFYRPASGSVLVNTTSTTTVFDGNWHHIALVGNANNTTLYVDGNLDATNFSYTRPAFAEQTGTMFGAQDQCCNSTGGFSLPYSGEIDEIRLWSTNRSQTQIRDNMCQKLSGSESNLEIYYPLNQTSGTTVNDFSTATVRNGSTSHISLSAPFASWGLSGAPVGNESIHDFSVSLTTSLNIAAAAGDDLTANITAIGTTPSSIHIYKLDNAPDNATPPGTQTQLSTTTYYGVKVFGGSGVVYSVVYNYDGHAGIVDENTLELAKRDDNEDLTWNQEAATLNTTLNTLTLSGQTGTEYILADIATNPLPISLLSFNVNILNNQTVQLDWQTASEINNDFFTIERSVNGKNWEVLNNIDGAGNSSSILNYETIDKNPYIGVSYYRLKQTDFDGQYSYSEIRSVKINNLENIQLDIYPNPTGNEITVIGNVSELKQIKIYNVLGRDATKFTELIINNDSKLVIDLSNLSTGMYFIKTKTTANKVYKQ